MEVGTVNYAAHGALVVALRGTELCICAISLWERPEEPYETEVAVIRAAEDAGVRNFVPSEWEGVPAK